MIVTFQREYPTSLRYNIGPIGRSRSRSRSTKAFHSPVPVLGPTESTRSRSVQSDLKGNSGRSVLELKNRRSWTGTVHPCSESATLWPHPVNHQRGFLSIEFIQDFRPIAR